MQQTPLDAKFTQTILLILGISLSLTSSDLHYKYEYKYSFRPPLLDSNNHQVPNFVASGNTLLSENVIRLTSSMEHQSGTFSATKEFESKWWEVVIEFRVSGTHMIGADGFAFWYVRKALTTGTVFGAADHWDGLGIMFDSYDNDHTHDNPSIYAIINNGSASFNHDQDGRGQHIGKCQIDFRNSHYPPSLRIRYFQNTLTASYFHGHAQRNSQPAQQDRPRHAVDFPTEDIINDGLLCFKLNNVELHQNGFFGFSAMTGNYGDDHDIISFHVFSINPDSKLSDLNRNLNSGPRKKTTEELEYEKFLQSKAAETQRSPDSTKHDSGSESLDFEEDYYERSLHGIESTQSHITQMLVEIKNILVSGGRDSPNVRSNTDFNIILNEMKRELSNFASNIRNAQPNSGGSASSVTELVTKVQQMIDSLSKMNQDLRPTLDRIHQAVLKISSNQASAAGKESASSSHLVSQTFLIVCLLFQTSMIIGFCIYRDQTTNRKKFY